MASPNLKLAMRFLVEEPHVAAQQLSNEPAQDICKLLQTLSPLKCADLLKLMQALPSSRILCALDARYCADLLTHLKVADIAAMLRVLDPYPRKQILALLPLSRRTVCQRLVGFADNAVGAWVETDVLTLDAALTLGEAIKQVKHGHHKSSQQIFILNSEKRLLGSVSIYDLLRHPPTTPLSQFMNVNLPTLSGFADIETALRSPVWKARDSVCVVNNATELIGMVHHHRLRSVMARIKQQKIRATSVLDDMVLAYTDAYVELSDLIN